MNKRIGLLTVYRLVLSQTEYLLVPVSPPSDITGLLSQFKHLSAPPRFGPEVDSHPWVRLLNHKDQPWGILCESDIEPQRLEQLLSNELGLLVHYDQEGAQVVINFYTPWIPQPQAGEQDYTWGLFSDNTTLKAINTYSPMSLHLTLPWLQLGVAKVHKDEILVGSGTVPAPWWGIAILPEVNTSTLNLPGSFSNK